MSALTDAVVEQVLGYERMMNEVIRTRTRTIPTYLLSDFGSVTKETTMTTTTSTAPSHKPIPLPIQSLLSSRANSITNRSDYEANVKEYTRLTTIYQEGVDKYDAQVNDYDKALKKLGYVAPKAPK